MEIRWADGSRFGGRRSVSLREAQLLVEGGICAEVRSPTGLLRYLKMRRNPPLKKFASVLAQADFTVTTIGMPNGAKAFEHVQRPKAKS